MTFEVGDLAAIPAPRSDVVSANLTRWLLERSAAVLAGAVRTGGLLIASGFHPDECSLVTRAFGNATVVWQDAEQAWAALAMKKL